MVCIARLLRSNSSPGSSVVFWVGAVARLVERLTRLPGWVILMQICLVTNLAVLPGNSAVRACGTVALRLGQHASAVASVLKRYEAVLGWPGLYQ